MTKDEVHRLAKCFETQTYNAKHTEQTRDVMAAISEVLIRFWVDMPEPKPE